MRAAVILVLCSALAIMVACGDDDTDKPDAGGYYGGVHDITISLQDDRADTQVAPSGDPAALAEHYRAEVERFRAFADGLEALEPTDIARARHEDLVLASRAIADGFEELASLAGEESTPDVIQSRQDVVESLGEQAFAWNIACVAIDLFADDYDLACHIDLGLEGQP